MTYMGWAFKSPRRHKVAQWRKVEFLRRAGHMFRGNQHWPVMKSIRQARDFVAEEAEKGTWHADQVWKRRLEASEARAARRKTKRRTAAKRRGHTQQG